MLTDSAFLCRSCGAVGGGGGGIFGAPESLVPATLPDALGRLDARGGGAMSKLVRVGSGDSDDFE